MTKPLSLLFDDQVEFFRLADQTVHDLELTAIWKKMAGQPHLEGVFRDFLLQQTLDLPLLHRRQQLFADLAAHPDLLAGLERSLKPWRTLADARAKDLPGSSSLFRSVSRLGELTAFVELILHLEAWLKDWTERLQSAVWRDLTARVSALAADALFRRLVTDLPRLREQTTGVRAVTVGLNLDHNLQPIGAILMDIHNEPLLGRRASVIANLFQGDNPPLGPLHSPPLKELMTGVNQTTKLDPDVHGYAVNPQSLPIFRDMGKILERAAQPVEKELKAFLALNTEPWARLADEVTILVGAGRFFERLRDRGLPVCLPELLPEAANTAHWSNLHNLALELALATDQQPIGVANNADFDDRGRLQLVTGPNKGGKTVYLQANGLAQVLAQVGLPVCAQAGQVSPVRRIFTHYPLEESVGRATGRFGDEIARLMEFFQGENTSSLVLLNEALTGTHAEEGYFIARDLMKVFRKRGCRLIFTTHLHELARDAEQINAESEGASALISLVSRVEPQAEGIRRTFRILPGPPEGRSYARDLAKQYGLDLEKLLGVGSLGV